MSSQLHAENENCLTPLEQANQMAEMKSYQKAVELYSKYLLSCPAGDVNQFLEIYDKRSALFLTMGLYTSAVDDCTFILKMTPANTSVLTRRMHAYEKLGNIISAINDKKKIHEYNKKARAAANNTSPTPSTTATSPATTLTNNPSTASSIANSQNFSKPELRKESSTSSNTIITSPSDLNESAIFAADGVSVSTHNEKSTEQNRTTNTASAEDIPSIPNRLKVVATTSVPISAKVAKNDGEMSTPNQPTKAAQSAPPSSTGGAAILAAAAAAPSVNPLLQSRRGSLAGGRGHALRSSATKTSSAASTEINGHQSNLPSQSASNTPIQNLGVENGNAFGSQAPAPDRQRELYRAHTVSFRKIYDEIEEELHVEENVLSPAAAAGGAGGASMKTDDKSELSNGHKDDSNIESNASAPAPAPTRQTGGSSGPASAAVSTPPRSQLTATATATMSHSAAAALSAAQVTPNIREAMMSRKSLVQSKAQRRETPQIPPLVLPQSQPPQQQQHQRQQQQEQHHQHHQHQQHALVTTSSQQYRPQLDNLAPLHQQHQHRSYNQHQYQYHHNSPYGTQGNTVTDAHQQNLLNHQSPSPQTDNRIDIRQDESANNSEQGVFIASAAAPLAANRGIRDSVLNQRSLQAPRNIFSQQQQAPPQTPIRGIDEADAAFERRKEMHRMNTVSFRNIYSDLDDELPSVDAPRKFVGSTPDAKGLLLSPQMKHDHNGVAVGHVNLNTNTHIDGDAHGTMHQLHTTFSDIRMVDEPDDNSGVTNTLQSHLSDLSSLSRSESSQEITDPKLVIRAKDSFYVAKAHHHEHMEGADGDDDEDDEEKLDDVDEIEDEKDEEKPPTNHRHDRPMPASALKQSINKTVDPSSKQSSSSTNDKVSQRKTKTSVAKSILYTALKDGLTVIKHGRQGAPKRRILTCDSDVTHIFWREESVTGIGTVAIDSKGHPIDGKGIKLSDVRSLRVGTEIDPTTVPNNDDFLQPKKKGFLARFGGGGGSSGTTGARKDEFLYGTAVLRRHCKFSDLELCLSLITIDRTFDIQCLSKRDFDLLKINLSTIVANDMTLLESAVEDLIQPKSIIQSAERSQRKKSVRFSISDHECDPFATSHNASASADSPRVDKNGRNSEVVDVPLSKGDFTGVTHKNSATVKFPAVDSTTTLESKHPFSDPRSQEPQTNAHEQKPQQLPAYMLNHTMSNNDLNFNEGDAVYEMGLDSDNYDLLLMPLANYAPPELEGPSGSGNTMMGNKQPQKFKAYDEYKQHQRQEQHQQQQYQQQAQQQQQQQLQHQQHYATQNNVDFYKQPIAEPATGNVTETREIVPRFGDDDSQIQRMSSSEALRIGLLLSEQEAQFGINMYDSLQNSDEPELERLTTTMNMTTEEALLEIFQRRFNPKHQGLIAMQNRSAGLVVSPRQGNPSPASQPMSVSTPQQQLSPVPPNGAGGTSGGGTVQISPVYGQNLGEESLSYDGPIATAVSVGPHQQTNQFAARATPVQAQQIQHLQQHTQQQQQQPQQPAIRRMTSFEALQIGLLLSQQESEYGTNMYDSLSSSDEPAIRQLMMEGFNEDDALHEIFKRKYVYNPNHNYMRGQQPQQQLQQQQALQMSQQQPYQQQAHQQQAPYMSPPPVQQYQAQHSVSAVSGMGAPTDIHGMRNPRNTAAGALQRMNSEDALALMLIVSQQEADHGINMYDSLVPSDESEVMNLIQQRGLTHEQAVQCIFETRYPPKNTRDGANRATTEQGRPPQYEMPPVSVAAAMYRDAENASIDGSLTGSVRGGGGGGGVGSGSVQSDNSYQQYPPPPRGPPQTHTHWAQNQIRTDPRGFPQSQHHQQQHHQQQQQHHQQQHQQQHQQSPYQAHAMVTSPSQQKKQDSQQQTPHQQHQTQYDQYGYPVFNTSDGGLSPVKQFNPHTTTPSYPHAHAGSDQEQDDLSYQSTPPSSARDTYPAYVLVPGGSPPRPMRHGQNVNSPGQKLNLLQQQQQQQQQFQQQQRPPPVYRYEPFNMHRTHTDSSNESYYGELLIPYQPPMAKALPVQNSPQLPRPGMNGSPSGMRSNMPRPRNTYYNDNGSVSSVGSGSRASTGNGGHGGGGGLKGEVDIFGNMKAPPGAPKSSPSVSVSVSGGGGGGMLTRKKSTVMQADDDSQQYYPQATSSYVNPLPVPNGGLTRKKSIFSLSRKNIEPEAASRSIRYKEKDVKTITLMGYTKDQAVTALIQCDNNVQAAIQCLSES